MFTQQNRAEVPSQLVEDSAEVLCGEHLASDQEEDTDGCKPDNANSDMWPLFSSQLVNQSISHPSPDDPGGDGHHGLGQAGEELQQGAALLPDVGQGHAEDDREEDEAEDVGARGPLALELPGEGVVWVTQLQPITSQ